ncbi:protein-disulfide reductase DsbD family protein [Jannaschia rubra]|uniref:Thiol:disulfide interchange protein DsbD n=1 Tax=Jannaschia rubra TaxID=282197 RepID=A0A0M6XTT8_9RHOB|nr:protein-disulfide reductase DsbD domain-containing protein [Jannaschia rubra]CTQ33673.1 Thiol:disulfide interchange protein DsbD precursor [Jannaschia rubra]SFG06241.1 suppressor for copper-sensitivity B [Jannaschia rubra]
MSRILTLLFCLLATPLAAAVSDPASGSALTARLLSAEDGIGPGGETVSAGLQVDLQDGWKTYWRSPGEVGLPPEISWEGSDNIASVELSYPAPSRFDAFDIQNFGYSHRVVYPLTVLLRDAGAPATLRLRADLLVCAEICVPETVEMALDLPRGGGLDADSAATLAEWIGRVPGNAEDAGVTLEQVHLDETALTLTARADMPFEAPDVFPEHGDRGAFDAPEIVLSDGGRSLWARLPVVGAGEGPLDLTLVDGARAATVRADLADAPPSAPRGGGAGGGLLAMLLVAVLGGLILNVMPCVLPVLSIKLAAALQAGEQSATRVRAGFLASAAGVMAFFLGLAAVIVALRAAGVAVGWGIQFQSPVFLALMIGLIAVFAANMMGFFSLSLGQGAMTGMARAGSRGGWGGDFATGAFAAVMATPCSAPFIGTAVTYALTSGPAQIVAVFAAMGLGLATPYLAVAARPGIVRRLPRPGRWMRTVQMVLGGLLLLTAVWLLTVLAASAGARVAVLVAVLTGAMLVALAARRRTAVVIAAGLACVVAGAAVMPAPPAAPAAVAQGWEAFERERIAIEVAAGNTVFVDVTADWCLTCKANKRLVLERGAVPDALAGLVALQADWTRPDDRIATFLSDNGRFGIPFDAVYGPAAPEGIVLPELLTESMVLEAIDRAGG